MASGTLNAQVPAPREPTPQDILVDATRTATVSPYNASLAGERTSTAALGEQASLEASTSGGLRAPFPWFGGKTRVAGEVWKRFGNPQNYVEPFLGSAAILLARPNQHQPWSKFETANDLDGNISNFFRSIAQHPEQVAQHASHPVNELDLTARHLWLNQHRTELSNRLMADPDFCDPKAAGWWVWGINAWVGGDWCSGAGPYTGTEELSVTRGGVAPGVYRKIPMISGAHGGKGTHRPRAVTGSAMSYDGTVVPDVTGSMTDTLIADFNVLANRLRRVRVTSGDWTRVLGNAATPPQGHITAVFLDPPYDQTDRHIDLYAVGDRPENREVAVHEAARTWALERTADASLRIAYCSYSNASENELFTHAGWSEYRWAAAGGYGLASDKRGRENKDREVVWFSPSCLKPVSDTPSLFDELSESE